MKTIKMYPRPDGRAGVRNRIAVISTVACSAHVAEQIAQRVPLADAYTHPYGCDQLGDDHDLSFHCLAQMGSHPNVGAALVIGLGCEQIHASELCAEIAKRQPNCAYLDIQDAGGTTTTIEQGVEIASEFAALLEKMERVDMPLSALTIGLECGGSDFTSGLAANPAVGKMAERLAEDGCKLIFGETTELMGAEGVLEKLCPNRSHYEWICQRIGRMEKVALDMKVDLRGSQPTPGNIKGGLTTIEEKSLGAVCKIGSLPIQDVLEFAQEPTVPGVSFMDTPGNDLVCTLGLSAGGAHILLFTTGRGTPMGWAASPIIKLTGNKATASRMRENMDVDLSGILDRAISVQQGGDILYEKLLRTAEGDETASERLGHREFGLYRTSPVLV